MEAEPSSSPVKLAREVFDMIRDSHPSTLRHDNQQQQHPPSPGCSSFGLAEPQWKSSVQLNILGSPNLDLYYGTPRAFPGMDTNYSTINQTTLQPVDGGEARCLDTARGCCYPGNLDPDSATYFGQMSCASPMSLVRSGLYDLALSQTNSLLSTSYAFAMIGSIARPWIPGITLAEKRQNVVTAWQQVVNTVQRQYALQRHTSMVVFGVNDFIPQGAFNLTIPNCLRYDPYNATGHFNIHDEAHCFHPSLEQALVTFRPLLPPKLHNGTSTEDPVAIRDFKAVGCYTVDSSDGAPVTYVILNTLVFLTTLQPQNSDANGTFPWRPKYQPPSDTGNSSSTSGSGSGTHLDPTYASDGDFEPTNLAAWQLDWLNQTLMNITNANRQAIILGESPYGINAKTGEPFWVESATSVFGLILSQWCSTIGGIFVAMTMRSSVRLLGGTTCQMPMSSVGGLSPLTVNNPIVSSIQVGLCSRTVNKWLQDSASIPDWGTQRSRSGEMLTEPPRVVLTTETDARKETVGTTDPNDNDSVIPFTALRIDFVKSFFGSSPSVSTVSNYLSMLLYRSQSVAFQRFATAAAGGRAMDWSYQAQRAFICQMYNSNAEEYSECTNNCADFQDGDIPNYGFDGFPPVDVFRVSVPWVFLRCFVAATFIGSFLIGSLLQLLRWPNLIARARAIQLPPAPKKFFRHNIKLDATLSGVDLNALNHTHIEDPVNVDRWETLVLWHDHYQWYRRSEMSALGRRWYLWLTRNDQSLVEMAPSFTGGPTAATVDIGTPIRSKTDNRLDRSMKTASSNASTHESAAAKTFAASIRAFIADKSTQLLPTAMSPNSSFNRQKFRSELSASGRKSPDPLEGTVGPHTQDPNHFMSSEGEDSEEERVASPPEQRRSETGSPKLVSFEQRHHLDSSIKLNATDRRVVAPKSAPSEAFSQAIGQQRQGLMTLHRVRRLGHIAFVLDTLNDAITCEIFACTYEILRRHLEMEMEGSNYACAEIDFCGAPIRVAQLMAPPITLFPTTNGNVVSAAKGKSTIGKEWIAYAQEFAERCREEIMPLTWQETEQGLTHLWDGFAQLRKYHNAFWFGGEIVTKPNGVAKLYDDRYEDTKVIEQTINDDGEVTGNFTPEEEAKALRIPLTKAVLAGVGAVKGGVKDVASGVKSAGQRTIKTVLPESGKPESWRRKWFFYFLVLRILLTSTSTMMWSLYLYKGFSWCGVRMWSIIGIGLSTGADLLLILSGSKPYGTGALMFVVMWSDANSLHHNVYANTAALILFVIQAGVGAVLLLIAWTENSRCRQWRLTDLGDKKNYLRLLWPKILPSDSTQRVPFYWWMVPSKSGSLILVLSEQVGIVFLSIFQAILTVFLANYATNILRSIVASVDETLSPASVLQVEDQLLYFVVLTVGNTLLSYILSVSPVISQTITGVLILVMFAFSYWTLAIGVIVYAGLITAITVVWNPTDEAHVTEGEVHTVDAIALRNEMEQETWWERASRHSRKSLWFHSFVSTNLRTGAARKALLDSVSVIMLGVLAFLIFTARQQIKERNFVSSVQLLILLRALVPAVKEGLSNSAPYMWYKIADLMASRSRRKRGVESPLKKKQKRFEDSERERSNSEGPLGGGQYGSFYAPPG